MKAYILVNKESDDYSTLPSKYERRFLFKYMTCRPQPEYVTEILSVLKEVLDAADENDAIIFNGPSWLIALAGYVWFSQEQRARMRMLIYDNVTHIYREVDNDHSA